MMGEQLKKVALIVPGDLIDVNADFDEQKVHFWKNEKYQGFLESVKMKMQEGKLYRHHTDLFTKQIPHS